MKTNADVWRMNAVAALGGAAVLMLLASGAHAGSRVELRSTGLDADARGRAVVRVRGTSGRFDVKVAKLDPLTAYEVFVDGVLVGTIPTSTGGSGALRFRSRVRGVSDHWLGFDPRGALLVIRRGDGRDVLAARVPEAQRDAGDITCCVPDDSGTECEDRTPAECTAAGGTVSTASSCLPDPCGSAAPPEAGDLVCCIPDDSGPECEDRTASECAAANGIAISASSCLDNPCVGIPPADPDIRCCLADDSGTECEDRTPAQCAAEAGSNIGPGICTVDACVGLPPPGGSAATVRVRCERRSNRSKISVDGAGLAQGSYTARAVSGANEAVAGPQQAVLGEAEFDFDSDAGNIAAGATPIAPDFLQGNPPQALGQIRDAQGVVIAESVATCTVR